MHILTLAFLVTLSIIGIKQISSTNRKICTVIKYREMMIMDLRKYVIHFPLTPKSFVDNVHATSERYLGLVRRLWPRLFQII